MKNQNNWVELLKAEEKSNKGRLKYLSEGVWLTSP